jgi:hypothetical protein
MARRTTRYSPATPNGKVNNDVPQRSDSGRPRRQDFFANDTGSAA